MDIKNKRVLVTGGAIRIGSHICRSLNKHGASLIIHYNTSQIEAEKLFKELGGAERGHILVKGDFSDVSCVDAFFEDFGKVDVLINNASTFKRRKLLDEDTTFSMEQFQVNFWTPLSLMKQFKKQQLKNSLIINILDSEVSKSSNISGSYILSKKSLAEATRLAALQWAPNVRVNAVAPGIVIPPKGMEKSKMEKSIRSIPQGRSVAIKEIVSTCMFLIDNESVTGEVIYVDGGLHL